MRHGYSVLIVTLTAAVAAIFALTALGSNVPVGKLPPGPVTTTKTTVGQLTAVALPRTAGPHRGYVWRLARNYDSTVVREISEADVGANIVIVYRIVGRGHTSLVYAMTRGDSSPVATKAVTTRIDVR
jgi:hypothetical protein